MFCFFAAFVTLTSLASSLPAGASMGNTFEIHLLVDIRKTGTTVYPLCCYRKTQILESGSMDRYRKAVSGISFQ